MTEPKHATDYDLGLAVEARCLCLTVATILGDLLDDIVVIGGLVPYLIVEQEGAEDPHVGTRDLDLGLALAVLDGGRYEEISERLRREGFQASEKEDGGIRRPTWVLPGTPVSIDFLMPPVDASAKPGKLHNLEGDFAAIITAGLELAFVDAKVRTISRGRARPTSFECFNFRAEIVPKNRCLRSRASPGSTARLATS